MPIYHPLGNQILSRQTFLTQAEDFKSLPSFAVSGVAAGKNVRDFADIGFGKPLSIVIRHIYTGSYPEKQLFGSDKPMLITSALKDITTTAGAAQALNMLQQHVKTGSRINGPSASDQGTPLVYYTPAVASVLINVTMLMAFENFNQDLFGRASQLFTSLAGVPIFMPASAYLIGAGTMLKLAGNVTSSLVNGRPVLNQSLQLDFSFGGGTIPTPGFWLLSENPIDLHGFTFDANDGLTETSTGRPYSGPEPFIILGLDGTKQDTLKDFTPLMASASVLGRFLNQQENAEVALDAISNSIEVANDLMFRRKADLTKQQLSAATPGSADAQRLKLQYDAFVANIQEPLLRGLADLNQIFQAAAETGRFGELLRGRGLIRERKAFSSLSRIATTMKAHRLLSRSGIRGKRQL